MQFVFSPTGYSPWPRSIPVVLVVGDVLTFVVFAILGRVSHGQTGEWLQQLFRITSPFLVGWAVASILVQAYRIDDLSSSGAFLVRSVLALLAADLIAFGIRAIGFGDTLTLPFAVTTIGVTATLMLCWRGTYVWWRRIQKN